MRDMLLAHPVQQGTGWTPLFVLAGFYIAIVCVLAIFGRGTRRASGLAAAISRVPAALERVTGFPGWVAGAVGTTLMGLLIASEGFESDIAQHIEVGRDTKLFTAPHTMILVGIGLFASAAAIGVLFASVQGPDVGIRWKGVRVPWSMIPLGLLGAVDVVGFPLDAIWHRYYGIDVTLWSGTHLMLIMGVSLAPLACWLALAEAKVRPSDSWWARVVHVLLAAIVLTSVPLDEFVRGVPQFQQLYHPVLIAMVGGFALVATRVVFARGGAVVVAALSTLLFWTGNPGSHPDGHIGSRIAALQLGSGVVVELVALLAGTERRLRFAMLSGLGVGTLGLGTEWLWNARGLTGGAHQPWTHSLIPDAFLAGTLAALGAAVLGVVLGGVLKGEPARVGRVATSLGAAAVIASLVLPGPRRVGDVRAEVELVRGDAGAMVHVVLDPPDAAEDARWFQVMSWQGGGLVLANMEPVARGRYVSERSVPIGGTAKTLLRLHRGAEMMAIPIALPADPEIGAPEIGPRDGVATFVREQQFLMRESRPGPAGPAVGVYAVLAIMCALVAAAFAVAISRISQRREDAEPSTASAAVARSPGTL